MNEGSLAGGGGAEKCSSFSDETDALRLHRECSSGCGLIYGDSLENCFKILQFIGSCITFNNKYVHSSCSYCYRFYDYASQRHFLEYQRAWINNDVFNIVK